MPGIGRQCAGTFVHLRAAPQVPRKRHRQFAFILGLPIDAQPAIKCVRESLHFSAQAHIACPLFAHCFVETDENGVGQALRCLIVTRGLQGRQRQPGMQHHHIEPAVDGIRHREIAEKHGFARPGYQAVIQALAFLLARPGFPEQIQHETIPMDGGDLQRPVLRR